MFHLKFYSGCRTTAILKNCVNCELLGFASTLTRSRNGQPKACSSQSSFGEHNGVRRNRPCFRKKVIVCFAESIGGDSSPTPHVVRGRCTLACFEFFEGFNAKGYPSLKNSLSSNRFYDFAHLAGSLRPLFSISEKSKIFRGKTAGK